MKSSPLPSHKTRIVATLGPATDDPGRLEGLVRAGMNIARLNFSHGNPESHAQRIDQVRAAAKAAGRRVAILADLPGPKIRIGRLESEPLELESDGRLTLTTRDIVGNRERIAVNFEALPRVVEPGNRLFLNDGLVELEVEKVEEQSVLCRVLRGGELRSRKGLNFPGIDLKIPIFTEQDRACLKVALKHGVDAVSQSFVETAENIKAVREAAQAEGKNPFVIAKIERRKALENLDAILEVADGLMVARGDLGVEIPIEQIAHAQKEIIAKANLAGKPVITATQMLESMVTSPLPTRAEATDVANAVLDGSDCLMLSAESAVGENPEGAVAMLAKIAGYAESRRPRARLEDLRARCRHRAVGQFAEAMASMVEHALQTVECAAVFVPTRTGSTARMVARFKPASWIVALVPDSAVAHRLAFSYGIQAEEMIEEPDDWNDFASDWLQRHHLGGKMAMLVAGPSPRHPEANPRFEFLSLD